MGIYWKNIDPQLQVLGPLQQFIYNQNLSQWQLVNNFVPTATVPAETLFDFANTNLDGFRFRHVTQQGDTIGTLKLQTFINNITTGPDIMTFNPDGSIAFNGIVFLEQVSIDGALNMNGFPINNLLNPVTAQDAATKNYVDASTSGAAPNSATYITKTSNASLPNAQVLASLSTGIVKNTTSTGVLSIAVAGTDYYAPDVNLNLDLNSHRIINLSDPINPQDGATQSWVLSQIDNTFGPDVALPFAQLNFNWANGSGGIPYIFNHTINDSAPFFKQHIYQVTSLSPDVQRTWQALYSLGDPNAWNPEYSLTFYHPIFSPGGTTPFQLLNIGGGFSPVWGLFIQATIDMGGFEIKNALNPTTAQSLATKNYVDTSTITLTGSVTGSGNVNGSFATSFSNSQTVSGTTQTFNYSNALTSSIFSLVNTNAAAVTYFKAGTSTDSVQLGYDGSNDYSFINLVSSSNDRLAFRVNGTGIAALLASGLFGLGTITPTQAKLVVNGGVQNVAGEESCIRAISALNSAKIELQNTTPSTGKLYEVRSSSTGTFDITDRTGSATRLSISTLGNVGIGLGLSLANSLMQFPNASAQRLITLYEGTNNTYQYTGFGTNAGSLYTYLYSTSALAAWYAATSATASNQIAVINGNGTAQFTKIAGYAATKPSVASAGSLGTGATFTLSGSELSGTLIVNSGNPGNTAGPLLAFTLVNAMPNANWGVVFFPANGNAANVSNSIFAIAANTFQFTLNARTALANNTTYIWNYMIIGA